MKARLILLAGAFLVNLGAAPVTDFVSPLGNNWQQMGGPVTPPSSAQPPPVSTPPANPPIAPAPVFTSDDSTVFTTTDTNQPIVASDSSDASPSPAMPTVVRHYSIDDLASSIHSLSADYSDGTHYSIDDLASQMGGM